MRYAGKVNLAAIEWGFHTAKPGISLLEVDAAIEWYILNAGCKPAFKGYRPDGAASPFLFTACLSPNDVVVHGVPNSYVLKPGDLLTIDIGTNYQGWFVDAARTRIIAGSNPIGSKLINATEAIMRAQLSVIKDGCDFMTLINAATDMAHEHQIIIMPAWGGHGIGERIHMDPFVPNSLSDNQGRLYRCFEEQRFKALRFIAGQTYCIEPVCSYGTTETFIDQDGWTVRKTDKSLVAHEERCILVLNDGIEILS